MYAQAGEASGGKSWQLGGMKWFDVALRSGPTQSILQQPDKICKFEPDFSLLKINEAFHQILNLSLAGSSSSIC